MVKNVIVKKIVVCIIAASVMFMQVPAAKAGELDILVDKLVSKGILTPVEARTILDETRIDVREDLVKGQSYATPEWTQRVVLKGDLRTRYQYSETENNSGKGKDVRHQARIRLRTGVEAKVNDKVKVGFGLASGGSTGDARSTNSTLTNNFNKKDVWIDYAYAQYTPFEWADVLAGKFKQPIWNPSDLLWDTDINPEGAALQLHYYINQNVKPFMNTAFLIPDEQANDNDEVTIWAIQPGVELIHKNLSWKNAFTLYAVNGAQGESFTNAPSTRTNEDDVDFSCGALSTELAARFPEAPIKYAALLGDAVYNPDGNEPGFLGGLKLGDEKIQAFGNWQARALYRYLENNAFLDSYPDSDAMGGRTDVRGPEFGLDLGLGKNVSLGLDYYYMQRISQNNADTEHFFQTDINYKF
jgi:hypothetical protein